MRLFEDHDLPMDQVRRNVAEMLARARRSVFITTGLSSGRAGNAPPEGTLYDNLREELWTVASSVDLVRILLDCDVDPDDIRAHHPWMFDLPKTLIARAGGHVPHWVVVDGRDFRLEKPHELGTTKRDNIRILDCDPVIAEVLMKDAEAMWSGASAVRRTGSSAGSITIA